MSSRSQSGGIPVKMNTLSDFKFFPFHGGIMIFAIMRFRRFGANKVIVYCAKKIVEISFLRL
jgi:hypothetical protein